MRRLALAIVLCLASNAPAVLTAGSQTPPRDTRSPGVAPPREVTTAEELQPATATQRELARFYATEAPPLVRPPGDLRVFVAPKNSVREIDRTPSERRQLFCSSESLVLFGTATSHTVFLNRTESLLLTESVVRVDRWLSPTSGPLEVVIGSAGGRAVIDGVLYETTVPPEWPALAEPSVLVVFQGRGPRRLSSTYAIADTYPVVAGELDVLGFRGPVTGTLDTLSTYIAGSCPPPPPVRIWAPELLSP